MNSYRVVFSGQSKKFLKDCNQVLSTGILEICGSLGEQPWPPDKEKIQGRKSTWRVRLGEYRIVYEVDKKQREVRIIRIGDRKEVYRNF